MPMAIGGTERKQGKRLFVAVDLPDAVRAELVAMQREGNGVRWSAPETLHLTLCFIGNADPVQEQAIRASLRCVQGQPFMLRLAGTGFFCRNKQAVLWAGLEACDPLQKLWQSISTALFSLPPLSSVARCAERDLFIPHITLGRMRNPDQNILKTVTKTFAKTLSGFPRNVRNVTDAEDTPGAEGTADSPAASDQGTSFTVTSFVLFSSILNPHGVKHVVEERFPLS